MDKTSNLSSLYTRRLCDCVLSIRLDTPESFERQVGDGGTGGEVQVLQLRTELAEAVTRAAKRERDRTTI